MPREIKQERPLVDTAPEAASKPTPENTPPPGGGRWRWDIALPGWVDTDAAPQPALPARPV